MHQSLPLSTEFFFLQIDFACEFLFSRYRLVLDPSFLSYSNPQKKPFSFLLCALAFLVLAIRPFVSSRRPILLGTTFEICLMACLFLPVTHLAIS